MKTKIFGGIAIIAIAVAVAFNITLSNQKQDKASLLVLANVEALAYGEFTVTCGQFEGKCWAALGMMKYCGGEKWYNECVRTSEPTNYCKNPC